MDIDGWIELDDMNYMHFPFFESSLYFCDVCAIGLSGARRKTVVQLETKLSVGKVENLKIYFNAKLISFLIMSLILRQFLRINAQDQKSSSGFISVL
jgi:hypothetical protein